MVRDNLRGHFCHLTPHGNSNKRKFSWLYFMANEGQILNVVQEVKVLPHKLMTSKPVLHLSDCSGITTTLRFYNNHTNQHWSIFRLTGQQTHKESVVSTLYIVVYTLKINCQFDTNFIVLLADE